ncbi:hypothetical protein [Chryseosolibacter indicus]|uniref:Lipoprotein n=1 Tax=Chryseosolibacter indicus TaxID=2782351 RepID=A0ABS5VN68_9BACT|nr:hypothetical protein [Chryseosolibacter indicus]MBT1702299.1 hypothetical protein [Chryseosolibacter indicus]
MRIKQHLILLTASTLLLLLACKSKEKQLKTIDLGSFTIEAPTSWHPIKQAGIDSYVGQIAIDDRDTLFFDLGWYSNDLSEDQLFTVHEKNIYLLDEELLYNEDSLVYTFVGTTDSINVNRYFKDSVAWEVIDNRRAKIVRPKKTGVGTTGIFIDSLWQAGSAVDRFQMNGKNLKPENEKHLLTAIRTLKFKNN